MNSTRAFTIASGIGIAVAVAPAIAAESGLLPSAVARAVGANAIGAWTAIVLGLLFGGGAIWLAFAVLRRLSSAETEPAAPVPAVPAPAGARDAGPPAGDAAARLDAIVQSAMDAIITVDREQRIVLFNAAAERMFECPATAALGSPLDRFIPERFHAAHREHLDKFTRTGETARRMGLQTALAARRADGSEFPIEASISQAKVGGQWLLTVILRDVTERVLAERRIQQAQAALAEGEKRLEAIVASAMDAIITVDGEQRILLFNAAAERMFGMPAAAAAGGSLDRFIPERYRSVHRAHIERFVRTGATSRRMGVQTALSGLRSDGTEFPIEASISHATVGGQKLLTVILRDITERTQSQLRVRQAQDALHDEEARLEAIVRSAMDAIITIDREHRIVLFNAAAERMFGCPVDAALGGTLDRFIPERHHGAHRAHIDRFVRTGETSRRMGLQTALTGRRADGTEFPIEASISQATVGGQVLLTVILRDITERVQSDQQIRRAHDELRELSLAMAEVREGERTRIARELHDELGQALTALKMDVDLMRGMVPEDRDDLVERTGAMRELLDSTVATTRRISADLRPLVLDDLGLGAAAEWLVQTVIQRAGLECRLHIDPECAELGEPYASALFRIMQESITNVVRHARATRVDVRLVRADTDAVLTVADDGIGIDPGASPKPRSFGLRGINERVLHLNGMLSIASRAGAGTTLTVRFPLADAAARVTT